MTTHKLIWQRVQNKGADSNKPYEIGFTPLNWAAQSGYKELVQLLLASGADPNIENITGDTSLGCSEWTQSCVWFSPPFWRCSIANHEAILQFTIATKMWLTSSLLEVQYLMWWMKMEILHCIWLGMATNMWSNFDRGVDHNIA